MGGAKYPPNMSFKPLWSLMTNQLAENNQHFAKANAVLGRARNNLNAFNYDLAIRRPQEAFELYLKSLFLLLQKEHPTTHDLKKQIYEPSRVLKEFQIMAQQVARCVLANAVLGLWRLPAFYGDEKLGVANLFEPKDAELAVSYAELGSVVCNVVRSELYRRATAERRGLSALVFSARGIAAMLWLTRTERCED